MAKIKKVFDELEVGQTADFTISHYNSMSTTRHRLQKETVKRFKVRRRVIIERLKDAKE